MNETVLVVLCLSCAGFISGLTGFGFGLVAAGTLLSVRPPVEATALVLICSILSQGLSILRLRTKPPLSVTLVMTGAGLIGTPIGVYLLHDLSPRIVKLAVGTFLLLYSLGVGSLRADYRVAFGNVWSDGAVGFVGGILGGIAGLSGALPTAWSLVRGWPARQQRAIYQTFTLVIQLWSLIVLAAVDPLPVALIKDSVIALPTVFVSAFAGLALFTRIDQLRFRALVLVLLGIIGVSTAAMALIEMAGAAASPMTGLPR